MSVFVNILLAAYLGYLIQKMFSGDYDDITTQFEFIDLEVAPPTKYKDMNFLTFFTMYRYTT
jgi:hypothetical protein